MMKITGDLQHAKWMYLKAFLFGVISVVCVVALLIEYSNWRDAALLMLSIWAFCRLYYFCFYVIEKYIDPTFKFAGLSSVLVYWWRRK